MKFKALLCAYPIFVAFVFIKHATEQITPNMTYAFTPLIAFALIVRFRKQMYQVLKSIMKIYSNALKQPN